MVRVPWVNEGLSPRAVEAYFGDASSLCQVGGQGASVVSCSNPRCARSLTAALRHWTLASAGRSSGLLATEQGNKSIMQTMLGAWQAWLWSGAGLLGTVLLTL